MKIEMTNTHIYAHLPYSERETVKDLLNGVWSKTKKMWKFPRSYHVVKELVDLYPSFLDSGAKEIGTKLRMAQKQLAKLKTREDATGDERLRCYQRVDVSYLSKLPCAGVFNEPRTGKTPMTIKLLERVESKITLVVVPASLLLNWKKEIETWSNELSCFVIDGTPKKKQTTLEMFMEHGCKKVLIISKDSLKTMVAKLEKIKFDTMLIDEAHFLRNRDTAQSKACFKIGKKIERKYALTGTPTVKHAHEIFGILHFLYPDRFSSYWDFVNRYFEQDENYWGGKEIGDVKPHRKQELEELIALMSVQRKRNEVMQWLPPKVKQSIPVEMSKKQRKLYDDMKNYFLAEDEDGNEIDTPSVLSQLTRLRQICIDPRLVGLTVEGEKTVAIKDWLKDNNEPVVIMSMFTSYLNLLKEEIKDKRIGMITGEMTAKQKQEAAVKFQKGEIDVLLCNIIAAGTGFTLDKSDTIIFTDKAWNPSDQEQAEDRITPTTKEKLHSHNIITFDCTDSVDERINSLLDEKKDLTDIINKSGMKGLMKLL